MNQSMYLNVSELAKRHFTPTEIAIAGIVVNDFYTSFHKQDLLRFGAIYNLLFITEDTITAFIDKMVKCRYGMYDTEDLIDAEGNPFEPEFCFTQEFEKLFTKLITKEV